MLEGKRRECKKCVNDKGSWDEKSGENLENFPQRNFSAKAE